MGLLGKLFKNEAPKGGRDQSSGRTAPRVPLTSLHRVSFHEEKPSSGRVLAIANISTSGVGFLRESASSWPPAGSVLEGRLEVPAAGGRQAGVPARAKIVHGIDSGRVVGCAFVPEAGGNILAVQRLVRDYFRIELAALNMIHAPEDVLAAEPDGAPHWFHGKNNCELHYVSAKEDRDRLLRFQISFFANFVDGDDTGPVRYGAVVEDLDSGESKPRHKSAALVRWQEPFPPEMVEPIVRFISTIQGLPPSIRASLVGRIESVK